jgi:hypothetical protein
MSQKGGNQLDEQEIKNRCIKNSIRAKCRGVSCTSPFSTTRKAPPPFCWCEQFGGGGHYFKTMPETVDYCRSRKWITKAQAESIIAELKAKGY